MLAGYGAIWSIRLSDLSNSFYSLEVISTSFKTNSKPQPYVSPTKTSGREQNSRQPQPGSVLRTLTTIVSHPPPAHNFQREISVADFTNASKLTLLIG